MMSYQQKNGSIKKIACKPEMSEGHFSTHIDDDYFIKLEFLECRIMKLNLK